MTLEELEANLKLTLSLTSENEVLRQNVSLVPEDVMKAILLLTEGVLSLNSKLAEIETRLSTYMPGSEKPSEKPKPIGSRAIFPPSQYRSW